MRPQRDEDITGTDIHSPPAPGRPHLVAMWPGGSAVHELPPERAVSVGRSKASDLCIDHPSVSRNHATFHGGDPFEVEDHGSTNGTSVAGNRIPVARRVPVLRGQVVTIGAAVLARPGR